MLSILIPTYNYDCYRLVCDLQAQAMECGCRFEIIVADNASTVPIVNLDRINSMEHCRLIRRKENVGRPCNRNMLADSARYPYLLFIDADAEVCRPDFIRKYLSYCTPGCCVVGGKACNLSVSDKEYSLRMRYEECREANPSYRKSLTTFNLLIDKSLFMAVMFDESLSLYGNEDFLFGADPRIREHISFIDNPLIHDDVDVNPVFLRKTEEACANMLKIYRDYPDRELYKYSKLLKYFRLMEKSRCATVAAALFPVVKGGLLRNLTSPDPSLFMLDVYKLLYVCCLDAQSKKRRH